MGLCHPCSSLALACLLVAGCSDRPKLGQVRGTVTLDGKPLAQGTIIFESADARPATGQIAAGQIVAVSTYDTDDGVPVGQHNVAISSNAEISAATPSSPGEASSPKGDYMSGKSLIPAVYNDPSTSGLTADIQPGENKVEFKLVSQAGK